METNFYLKPDKLKELKSFIKDNLPTVRFKHNPIKTNIKGCDKLFITLVMDVKDSSKLNELFCKWYETN